VRAVGSLARVCFAAAAAARRDTRRSRGAALGLVAVLALAGGGDTALAVESADIVLLGGKVVTLDERRPQAQAIALRGAEIAAVGTNDEIARWIGSATRVIDLDGRLAVPGFIESHGHFMALGEALTELDLTTAKSWDEIVAAVAAAARTAAPGEWIVGRGWHQEKWTKPPVPAVEGNPVHAALSAASPRHPVLLTHASGHAAFANAKALELAGLDRTSKDPAGGELVRDERGELTGLLRESAQGPVIAALERARSARDAGEIDRDLRRHVTLAGQEALSHGVTSFHDAGSSFATIDFLRRLEDEGALPVRLYVMVRPPVRREGGPELDLDRLLPAYRSTATPDDYLVVRSIKRQIDGALGSHGAWLLEPYADLPRSSGLVLEPVEEIRRFTELAIRHGYQLAIHAIGDRANRTVLDLYEEAFARHDVNGAVDGRSARGGRPDLRWRIEHAQHLDPADIPRFARLGVIASMQGVHCTSDAPWVLKRLGPERAQRGAYVWRSLLASGAVVSNGTDVPVEPIDPLRSYYASVTRRTAGGDAFFPEQRMTRDEALRSYTLAAAYAAFEEDRKGSIEVGKLADVVVLSKDILTVAEAEILDAKVDLTILGGKIRFEAAGKNP